MDKTINELYDYLKENLVRNYDYKIEKHNTYVDCKLNTQLYDFKYSITLSGFIFITLSYNTKINDAQIINELNQIVKSKTYWIIEESNLKCLILTSYSNKYEIIDKLEECIEIIYQDEIENILNK